MTFCVIHSKQTEGQGVAKDSLRTASAGQLSTYGGRTSQNKDSLFARIFLSAVTRVLEPVAGALGSVACRFQGIARVALGALRRL